MVNSLPILKRASVINGGMRERTTDQKIDLKMTSFYSITRKSQVLVFAQAYEINSRRLDGRSAIP
jgi:hypothetical protein